MVGRFVHKDSVSVKSDGNPILEQETFNIIMPSKEIKDRIISIVTETIIEGEDLEDIYIGACILGNRRAMHCGRIFIPYLDVVFVLSMFCWWPFKPAVLDEVKRDLQNLRGKLFKNVSKEASVSLTLISAISKQLLLLTFDDLLLKIMEDPRYINAAIVGTSKL